MSIENMIALMEFAQFVQLASEESDRVGQLVGSIRMDESAVPVSTINARRCSCALRFRLLCRKYVSDFDSLFRLNLPFHTAQLCHALCLRIDDNIDSHSQSHSHSDDELRQSIMDLSQSIIRECFRMLRESFHRFKETPEFEEFARIKV